MCRVISFSSFHIIKGKYVPFLSADEDCPGAGTCGAEGYCSGTPNISPEVHPIMGKTAVGVLRGTKDYVHGPDDVVAYEMAGSAAVFRGDYKLMRNNPPFGDRQWRLYRPLQDPVEVNDLAKSKPEVVAELVAAYDRFAKEVNLIEVPDDYNVIEQLQKNAARNQGKEETAKVPLLD